MGNNHSYARRSIHKSLEVLSWGTCWRVGNGKLIHPILKILVPPYIGAVISFLNDWIIFFFFFWCQTCPKTMCDQLDWIEDLIQKMKWLNQVSRQKWRESWSHILFLVKQPHTNKWNLLIKRMNKWIKY